MDDPSRAATKALGLQALGHKHDTRCEQTTCGADTFEKAWTIQATAMADGGGGTADVVEDLYLKYFSDQITAIYRVHNPSKLDSIPALLTKHSARLPQLLEAIEKKYGVQHTMNAADGAAPPAN